MCVCMYVCVACVVCVSLVVCVLARLRCPLACQPVAGASSPPPVAVAVIATDPEEFFNVFLI